jgi:two-component system, OmpR family, sensor kinase
MLARFAWRAADADRHLDAEPARGLRIEGDRIRLEQALSNLVDNALRYGEGDVRLYGTSGETTELHVVDDGPGFPPDFSEQAFERFTRADTARGRGGAGLGLSIVRAIAEAHGGTAGALNSPSGGVDAWISLPAAAADGAAASARGLEKPV